MPVSVPVSVPVPVPGATTASPETLALWEASGNLPPPPPPTGEAPSPLPAAPLPAAPPSPSGPLASRQGPVPRCPPGMVGVPAGPFTRGGSPEAVSVAPGWPGRAHLPRPVEVRDVGAFCIDRYEHPGRPGALPTRYVPYSTAVKACQDLGRRLCRDDEWAKACQGPDGWLWPYGPEWRQGACNADAPAGIGDPRLLRPSGSYPACASPYGAMDMEGNVSEWVETTDPRWAGEAWLAGGTLWTGVYGRGCAARHAHGNGQTSTEDDGFRCCADPAR
ncbi:formylglycine-generating enzyme family protein [Myxococcota bacterium]|nr:formylglycine-generating enzyme family protein [Myxococcota bacterium]